MNRLEAPPRQTHERACAALAVAVALAVGGVGLVRGTWSIGGSDSSCYGLMADAFASGELQPKTPWVLRAPWPDALRTVAPAGFVPSPVVADGASPVCAPGFSLLLAPFAWVGGPNGVFVVTPITGAVLIWLTFVLGRRLAGAWAGLAAALLTASIPALLFQVVQPMNDVLATTLWTAVLVAASTGDPGRPWLLGVLTGVAVLVRPNLAPVAAAIAVWLAAVTWRTHSDRRAVIRHLLALAIAASPALVTLLALNVALFGNPFASGYGAVEDLFSTRHVVMNVRQYGRAIVETELGIPLLGIAAALLVRRPVRPIVWLVLAVSGSVIAVYLFYRPFAEWWYLRFLLPALVPLTTLAAVVMVEALHAPGRQRGLDVVLKTVACIGVALATLFGVQTAAERQAFDLQRLERRFRAAGAVVRDRFPGESVFITIWESGTLRFHAGRPSVLWDSLDPTWLDGAIAWLSAAGFDPYIVVEEWEVPRFRERFAGRSRLGQLDWPPRFEIDRQVRIFKPADRDAYLRGESVPTALVIPRR